MLKAGETQKSIVVNSPPLKPLMLYDGDCNFCKLWVHRGRLATGERVEYLPFQDARGAARHPEIPRERFGGAVQLILPDGSVHDAAEAIYRALARNPEYEWLLDLYQHSPVFVKISEVGYDFVARHRIFFSELTRLLWGRHIEPPRQQLVRWIFFRSLGIIYLFAFLSLWNQVPILIGSHGIRPATLTMAMAKQNFAAQSVGLNRYHLLPTLCWFDASDGFLSAQCLAGSALALLLILGIAPAPCLFLLWLIYLSLTTVCAALPGLQGDNLLLETGFLAMFLSPLQLLPARPMQESETPRIALWLLRWLLFRLTFASGALQAIHAEGSAWKYFFEVAAFGFDYILPFWIFLPRKPRQLAGLAFVALQILILPATGHVLFHVLIMALCVTLLDDATLTKWLPEKWQRQPAIPRRAQIRWPTVLELMLVVLVGCAGYSQFFKFIGLHMPGPEPIVAANYWLKPFRTFNTYSAP